HTYVCPLSLHDALPIYLFRRDRDIEVRHAEMPQRVDHRVRDRGRRAHGRRSSGEADAVRIPATRTITAGTIRRNHETATPAAVEDRKSTRLNSSHEWIS